MRVLVIANEELRSELSSGLITNTIQVDWIDSLINYTPEIPFDACLDLAFHHTPERIDWLNKIQVPLIIINSVITTLAEIKQDFVRINGWPTFLKRSVVEAATLNDNIKPGVTALFEQFGKKIEWVPDIPGFLTARVVASIINEAWFALDEKVSTPGEIDIAMKLGTNYPFGPFEWGEKIGLVNIVSLLQALSKKQERYKPSALLEKTTMI